MPSKSAIDYAIALANVGSFERLYKPKSRPVAGTSARINAKQGLMATSEGVGRPLGTSLFSAASTPFTITRNKLIAW